MKNFGILLIGLMLALNGHAQQNDVKQLAEKFVKAGDEQDADLMRNILHEEALQHLKYGEKITVMNKDQLVGLLSAKKIGGVERKTEVLDVYYLDDNTAVVKISAEGAKGPGFVYNLSMINENDSWTIVNILTSVKI